MNTYNVYLQVIITLMPIYTLQITAAHIKSSRSLLLLVFIACFLVWVLKLTMEVPLLRDLLQIGLQLNSQLQLMTS
jgi:hypothetical protein